MRDGDYCSIPVPERTFLLFDSPWLKNTVCRVLLVSGVYMVVSFCCRLLVCSAILSPTCHARKHVHVVFESGTLIRCLLLILVNCFRAAVHCIECIRLCRILVVQPGNQYNRDIDRFGSSTPCPSAVQVKEHTTYLLFMSTFMSRTGQGIFYRTAQSSCGMISCFIRIIRSLG